MSSTKLSASHGEERSKTLTLLFQPMFFIITIQILLLAQAKEAYSSSSSSPSHFSKFTRRSVPSKKEANNLLSFCKHTPHQAACESLFIKSSKTQTPQTFEHLFLHSVDFSITKAHLARAFAYNFTILRRQTSHNRHSLGGIEDCLELIQDSIELLDNVIVKTKATTTTTRTTFAYGYGHDDDDVQTWLSAALTNQETCLESLETDKSKVDRGMMENTAQNLSQFISNSLSLFMFTSRSAPKDAQNKEITRPSGVHARRLLMSHDFPTWVSGTERKLEYSKDATNTNPNGVRDVRSRERLMTDDFPTWVSGTERKLLQASVHELKEHAVVALDGSGTHKTIGEAIIGVVASLESSGSSGGRSVIHVKAGTYHEYIKIPTKQKNVMLIGDGLGKTTIVGDRNSDDGWTTYQSATVAAMGDGFIARDITFVNSAGPSKHQAVALRVGADKSVIFRCSIIGYQDTLYTHSKRQFYRETLIYGTVDFIFGNSAAVFQNCNIYARKPLATGLKNFVTAQGRSSPDQNTGISVHNCRISAASDLAPLKSKYETYLGRPWKQYSRTIVMQSYLDDSISRAGWSPWAGGFALKTLYYGEYMNFGPGASTSGRVHWPGYHASITSTAAQRFTVAGLISGDLWLPSTGVSFHSGLID